MGFQWENGFCGLGTPRYPWCVSKWFLRSQWNQQKKMLIGWRFLESTVSSANICTGSLKEGLYVVLPKAHVELCQIIASMQHWTLKWRATEMPLLCAVVKWEDVTLLKAGVGLRRGRGCFGSKCGNRILMQVSATGSAPSFSKPSPVPLPVLNHSTLLIYRSTCFTATSGQFWCLLRSVGHFCIIAGPFATVGQKVLMLTTSWGEPGPHPEVALIPNSGVSKLSSTRAT